MFLSMAILPLVLSPAPQDEEGFAHPELLVTTEWLLEHLEEEDVRIVDVRDEQAYAAGHIPRAVNVPRSATFDPESPRNVAAGEAIAALFGNLGVNEKTHTILYDEGKSTAAPRVFWTLELYGHPRVSVLDGGFAKWTKEELGAVQEVAIVEPVEFTVQPRAARLSTVDSVLSDLDVDEACIIDSRSEREWGAAHVPGAVHLEWTRNFTDDEAPVFRSPAALRAMYAEQGVTADKRVHAY